MPLFLTHVVNDERFEADIEGQEFPSTEIAVAEAHRSALAIVAQHFADGKAASAVKIFVETEGRDPVATVSVIATVSRQ